MSLSLVGITVMQIHWMQKTIKLNKENFNRAVDEALSSVVDKIEKEKDIRFTLPLINTPARNEHQDNNFSRSNNSKSIHLKNSNSLKKGGSLTYREESTSFYSNSELELNYSDSEFIIDPTENINNYFVLKNPLSINFAWDYNDTLNRRIKIVQGDTLSRVIVVSNGIEDTITELSNANIISSITPPPPPPPVDDVFSLTTKDLLKQAKQQQQALRQIIYEIDAKKTSLKDRINIDRLSTLLDHELKNKGLDLTYEYALIRKDRNNLDTILSPGFNKLSKQSTYSKRLFPNNYVPLNDFLEVRFNNIDGAIYKSVIIPISSSLFFTLIIILTFSITLNTIIKQKKLADMKADFINNMTHELKTPIATISLASDSIVNPKVVEKPESIRSFISIIREENSRMNRLVESVLQTARLERKTLKLNLKGVDFTALVKKVVDQMQIQAKAKNGEILFNAPAETAILQLDENLIENVVFNLIDNALKYNINNPIVTVIIKILPGGISLSVQDNGIGMSKSEQQRVFEKFYRVSQGDIHNIKGFGLGLSNVKEITELHGGLVQLRSELEKGSTFTLYFPFKDSSNG